MDYILCLILGVTLSSTCGFRVFIPPLVLSLSYKLDLISLPNNFECIKSDTALIIFIIAASIEIIAYYIPAIDNLLDTLSVPASFIVGTMVMGSFVDFDSELINWILAAGIGGTSAGSIGFATATVRATSSATTIGLGNWLVSTIELVSSIFLSIISILIPAISIVLLIIFILFIFYIKTRLKSKKV